MLSVGAVLAIIGLWVIAMSFSSSTEMELEKQVKNYIELRTMIANQNKVLALVDELGQKRIVWADLMAQFQDVVPPGTTMDTFTADTNLSEVEFAGRALTRNALVVFEERLNQLSWVAGVTAPRRNLLQRSNPDYSFNIQLDSVKMKNQSSDFN